MVGLAIINPTYPTYVKGWPRLGGLAGKSYMVGLCLHKRVLLVGLGWVGLGRGRAKPSLKYNKYTITASLAEQELDNKGYMIIYT